MKYTSAVIGAGRIGAQLEEDPYRQKPCTHLGVYLAHPQIDEVYVADISEKARTCVKDRWPKIPVYEDYRVMLKERRPDIVSVCTRVESHRPIVEDLAEWSIDHKPLLCFCEKPMALTAKDAAEMWETCKRGSLNLVVNHTRRWWDVWRNVADYIEENPLQAPFAVGYFSGDVLNDGIHMADLANWLNIPIQPVNIRGRYLIFELDILCSDRRITVKENGQTATLSEARPSRRYAGFSELNKEVEWWHSPLNNPMADAVDHIVKFLDSGGLLKLQSTGLDGLKALQTLEKWYPV